MRICVCFTAFAYVYVRLLFCPSCAIFAYVYVFLCAMSGFNLLKVSMILYWQLFDFLLSAWTLVIRWKYQWSNLGGYLILYFPCERSRFIESIGDPILRVLRFFFCASSLLLLDRLEDPIFRVPSSFFFARAVCYDWIVWGIRYLRLRRDFSARVVSYDWTVCRIWSLGSVEFFNWIYAHDSPSDLTLEVSCWSW